MPTAHTNIGYADALARRVIGILAILAGLTCIEGFFFSMPFLTELVLALLFAAALYFVLAGFRSATGVLGIFGMLLAALFAYLAVTHRGTVALAIGLVVGADGLITAAKAWSPLNALFHRDTHAADAQWGLPAARVH